jgi:hypothetical protein
MAFGVRNRWDLLAAIAAVIALIMIGLYIGLISQQGDHVAAWFLAGLASATLLSIYGALRAAPWRGLALAGSGVVMAVLGFLSILSIGFPIFCAGVLALVAAALWAGNRPVARPPAE